jgi:AcrR family transcriptional regulator
MAKSDTYRFSARHAAKVVTHDLLIVTARRLFRDQGFGQVTLRAIAHAAGLSTGAVLSHFRTKEEVWKAAIGGPPPDYPAAEQIALLQAERPGSGWLLAGRADGRFEAHLFGVEGDRSSAVGDSAEDAIRKLRDLLPPIDPEQAYAHTVEPDEASGSDL